MKESSKSKLYEDLYEPRPCSLDSIPIDVVELVSVLKRIVDAVYSLLDTWCFCLDTSALNYPAMSLGSSMYEYEYLR